MRLFNRQEINTPFKPNTLPPKPKSIARTKHTLGGKATASFVTVSTLLFTPMYDFHGSTQGIASSQSIYRMPPDCDYIEGLNLISEPGKADEESNKDDINVGGDGYERPDPKHQEIKLKSSDFGVVGTLWELLNYDVEETYTDRHTGLEITVLTDNTDKLDFDRAAMDELVELTYGMNEYYDPSINPKSNKAIAAKKQCETEALEDKDLVDRELQLYIPSDYTVCIKDRVFSDGKDCDFRGLSILGAPLGYFGILSLSDVIIATADSGSRQSAARSISRILLHELSHHSDGALAGLSLDPDLNEKYAYRVANDSLIPHYLERHGSLPQPITFLE